MRTRLLPEDERAELTALEDALPKTPLIEPKRTPVAQATEPLNASSVPPVAAKQPTESHETAPATRNAPSSLTPKPLPKPKPKPVMQVRLAHNVER